MQRERYKERMEQKIRWRKARRGRRKKIRARTPLEERVESRNMTEKKCRGDLWHRRGTDEYCERYKGCRERKRRWGCKIFIMIITFQ